jgi:hypothetical protein
LDILTTLAVIGQIDGRNLTQVERLRPWLSSIHAPNRPRSAVISAPGGQDKIGRLETAGEIPQNAIRQDRLAALSCCTQKSTPGYSTICCV